jgi:hypothetical protein
MTRLLWFCHLSATTVATLGALCLPVAAQTTPSAGGNGGTPYTIRCGPGQVAIGVDAKAGTYVNSVGLACVTVANVPVWVSLRINPATTGMAGGAGGALFGTRCPQGQVVNAISGRAALYVDRLQVSCAPFNSVTRRVTGPSSTQGAAAGGNGGAPFGPLVCPSNLPGVGFVGRAGMWIDRIALVCAAP